MAYICNSIKLHRMQCQPFGEQGPGDMLALLVRPM